LAFVAAEYAGEPDHAFLSATLAGSPRTRSRQSFDTAPVVSTTGTCCACALPPRPPGRAPIRGLCRAHRAGQRMRGAGPGGPDVGEGASGGRPRCRLRPRRQGQHDRVHHLRRSGHQRRPTSAGPADQRGDPVRHRQRPARRHDDLPGCRGGGGSGSTSGRPVS